MVMPSVGWISMINIAEYYRYFAHSSLPPLTLDSHSHSRLSLSTLCTYILEYIYLSTLTD